LATKSFEAGFKNYGSGAFGNCLMYGRTVLELPDFFCALDFASFIS